jgi:hypothetical protein
MDAPLEEPILIIKTAWGGKSLHTDFRAPSAGPFVFSDAQIADLTKRGKDVAEARPRRSSGPMDQALAKGVIGKTLKAITPSRNSVRGFK